MKIIYADYKSFRPALHKIVVFEYGDPEAAKFRDTEVPEWGMRAEYKPGQTTSGFGCSKRAYFVGYENSVMNGSEYHSHSLGWLYPEEVEKLESVPMYLWHREDIQSILAMLKPHRNGYDKMVFWSKYASMLENLPDIPVDGLANYRIVNI